MLSHCSSMLFFFFNDTATTEIYTLSLHDALPISPPGPGDARVEDASGRALNSAGVHLVDWDGYVANPFVALTLRAPALLRDRKSTRLNSSHLVISYAVFCLKKKKITTSQLLADSS